MADYGIAAQGIGMRDEDYDDDPRQVSGVRAALGAVERECDRFAKIAALLDERLRPVLQGEPPHEMTDDEKQPSPSSELAGLIQNHADRLASIGGSLDRIIARIDV